MRLTKHTDFALRVLLFLAVRQGERIATQSIADAYDISTNHLQKVVRALGELELVHLHRGVHGGVELARDPKEVSIGAVMRALDDERGLVECFRPETDACVVSPACHLKGALWNAQEAFYASLDSVTLADCVRRRAQELRKLTGS